MLGNARSGRRDESTKPSRCLEAGYVLAFCFAIDVSSYPVKVFEVLGFHDMEAGVLRYSFVIGIFSRLRGRSATAATASDYLATVLQCVPCDAAAVGQALPFTGPVYNGARRRRIDFAVTFLLLRFITLLRKWWAAYLIIGSSSTALTCKRRLLCRSLHAGSLLFPSRLLLTWPLILRMSPPSVLCWRLGIWMALGPSCQMLLKTCCLVNLDALTPPPEVLSGHRPPGPLHRSSMGIWTSPRA